MKWLFLTTLCLACHAADLATRLNALGMLESGRNDWAVGRHGERSQYQIKPDLWLRYFGKYSPVDAANQGTAANVATWILNDRINAFKARYGRLPNDYELSWLWHCPARLMGNQGLTPADRDYAMRFVALVEREGAK